MMRKLMIGTTALALAAGTLMTLPNQANAEPPWAWPAVAVGTAADIATGTVAAATEPFYDDDPSGYYSASYYDPDDDPSYVGVGYYGPEPGPGYYGGRCHFVTERAPDGTGFRARVCP